MLELDQEGINKRLQEHKQRVKEGEEKKLLEQTETDPNALPQRGILIRAWSRIREIFGGRDTIQATFDAYKTREAQVEKIREASGLAGEVGRETQEKITSAGQTAERMGLDASAETAKLTTEEQAAEAELKQEVDELNEEWFERGRLVSEQVERGKSPSFNLEGSPSETVIARKEEAAGKTETEIPPITDDLEAQTDDEGIETTEMEAGEAEEGPTIVMDREKTQVFTRKTVDTGEAKTKVESEEVKNAIKQFSEKSGRLSFKINKLPNGHDRYDLGKELDTLLERLSNEALIIIYNEKGLQGSEDEKIMLDLLNEYNTELTTIEKQIDAKQAEAEKIDQQVDAILQHMPEQVKSQVTDPEDQKKLAGKARQLLHEWNKIDTAKSGGGFVDHFSNPRQLEQASLQALKIREQEQAIRQDNTDILAGQTPEEATAIVTEARKRISSWDEADKDKPGFTSHFDNPYQRQEAVRQVMAEMEEKRKITKAREKERETKTEQEATTQARDEEERLDEADIEQTPNELEAKPTIVDRETTADSTQKYSQDAKHIEDTVNGIIDQAKIQLDKLYPRITKLNDKELNKQWNKLAVGPGNLETYRDTTSNRKDAPITEMEVVLDQAKTLQRELEEFNIAVDKTENQAKKIERQKTIKNIENLTKKAAQDTQALDDRIRWLTLDKFYEESNSLLANTKSLPTEKDIELAVSKGKTDLLLANINDHNQRLNELDKQVTIEEDVIMEMGKINNIFEHTRNNITKIFERLTKMRDKKISPVLAEKLEPALKEFKELDELSGTEIEQQVRLGKTSALENKLILVNKKINEITELYWENISNQAHEEIVEESDNKSNAERKAALMNLLDKIQKNRRPKPRVPITAEQRLSTQKAA